jgi:hypothetical protein
MSQLPLPPESAPDPAIDSTSTTELEEAKLVAFLQAHRPPVPAAVPDLEDRLMAAIAATPLPAALPVSPNTSVRNRAQRKNLKLKSLVVMAAGAILAGAAGIWGKQIWQPTPESALQMAQLEQFLETSWDVNLTDVDNPYGAYIPEGTESSESLHLEF